MFLERKCQASSDTIEGNELIKQPLHIHTANRTSMFGKAPLVNNPHPPPAISLQAKEAELLQINKILDDSEVTASKFRQWKENNEELVQEIERTTSLKASKDGDPTAESSPTEEPPSEPGEAETEGAYRWSLSDGEQLVDAEPSDVLLEMGSPGLETSPMLELSLGSLQESINKELSDMAVSGNSTENYFFI